VFSHKWKSSVHVYIAFQGSCLLLLAPLETRGAYFVQLSAVTVSHWSSCTANPSGFPLILPNKVQSERGSDTCGHRSAKAVKPRGADKVFAVSSCQSLSWDEIWHAAGLWMMLKGWCFLFSFLLCVFKDH